MPIDPENFWSTNYYGHPLLTEEIVSSAERLLGVLLPEEYLRLLRIQNGGYTKGFGYEMAQQTKGFGYVVPLNDLAGIVPESNGQTPLNILESAYMTDEWGLPPRQVILSGDGHWWITLDYRSGEIPSVAFIDVELEEDLQVAPSFAEFIKGLRPSEEFEGDI